MAPLRRERTLAQGPGALMDMMGNIGPIAMVVLALLLFASLYSWTVILGKISTFGKATKESRELHPRLSQGHAAAGDCGAGGRTTSRARWRRFSWRSTRPTSGRRAASGPPRNLTPLERSAQTAASESITGLERRMTWLATIAATSPFVGLFGTVMGVVDAFHGLGTAGAATLRAVAPGMAEALITTAAGLFVAVPAVVAYNQFTARIRVFASATDDFCRELLNALEEIPARAPAAAQPVAGSARRG